MRKFKYTVIIDFDDAYFEKMVKADPSIRDCEKLRDVPPENLVSVFAGLMTEGIEETLSKGLGDVGDSKLKVAFGGECNY